MNKLRFIINIAYIFILILSISSCKEDGDDNIFNNGAKSIYYVSVRSNNGGTVTISNIEVNSGETVELKAIPDNGYVFTYWTEDGEIVSHDNPYTAFIISDRVFYANFAKFTPEYVDLELPSGIKWATCNVGATAPEEYGDYFAWGETKPKGVYTSETYTFRATSEVLPLSNDAAYVNWGGGWRMPTQTEFLELINTKNCSCIWTTLNGVTGYKITSIRNGKSIFLPAAGLRSNYFINHAGTSGGYWSSSHYSNNLEQSCVLSFNQNEIHCSIYAWAFYGTSIRAVCN